MCTNKLLHATLCYGRMASRDISGNLWCVYWIDLYVHGNEYVDRRSFWNQGSLSKTFIVEQTPYLYHLANIKCCCHIYGRAILAHRHSTSRCTLFLRKPESTRLLWYTRWKTHAADNLHHNLLSWCDAQEPHTLDQCHETCATVAHADYGATTQQHGN